MLTRLYRYWGTTPDNELAITATYLYKYRDRVIATQFLSHVCAIYNLVKR